LNILNDLINFWIIIIIFFFECLLLLFYYFYFRNFKTGHYFGRKNKEALDKARSQLASLLNCTPKEIIFTSGKNKNTTETKRDVNVCLFLFMFVCFFSFKGGTEANNYAIKGFAFQNKSKGNHIITSKIEHPAIIEG